jgi:hypothetical protein
MDVEFTWKDCAEHVEANTIMGLDEWNPLVIHGISLNFHECPFQRRHLFPEYIDPNIQPHNHPFFTLFKKHANEVQDLIVLMNYVTISNNNEDVNYVCFGFLWKVCRIQR